MEEERCLEGGEETGVEESGGAVARAGELEEEEGTGGDEGEARGPDGVECS